MSKVKWIYKSTAIKRFKLTRNQVDLAIKLGLIRSREVVNPHYTSGPPATLVAEEDIEARLDEIRKLPKYSEEEKERRRIYLERKKLRDNLEFYCPRCKQNIRALRGSTTFEELFNREISFEEARKILMIAHYRHTHTNYESLLASYKARVRNVYERLRKEGYDFETAWITAEETVKEEEGIDREKIKRECNKKAVELLKEDGLL